MPIKKQKKFLATFTILTCLLGLSLGAQADDSLANGDLESRGLVLKIYQVDGVVNPNHSQDLDVKVHPGDRIRLSAALYDQDHQFAQQSERGFTWSANGINDKEISDSSFEPVTDGVIYDVPQSMGQTIVIQVTSDNASILNVENASDTITLENINN